MKKIHLICNAHIDPMWQWEWQEGAGSAISTFRVATEFCEIYDSFIFNHNEAILYQWVEEFEPELFERIQNLVKAGRWHIMGGWFIQPDCNMPSGESFLRHIQEGHKYFMDKFGVKPTTAINFDSFGHTKGLVQILEKSGYDSYIVTRPGEMKPAFTGELFLWEGFADSKIRVLKLPSYSTALGHSVESIKKEIIRQADHTNGVILWGVGNHGGGPSRIDLDNIANLITEEKEIVIQHSTPEEFFAATKDKKLKSYPYSLRSIMVGCYTSQIRIKQKHRRLENELIMTEKIVAAALSENRMAYPVAELNSAWKDLMFAQFHDILPGSSIKAVEEAGLHLLAHGLEETLRLKTRAFFRLCSGQKKAEEGQLPILVYNYQPYEVKAVVSCELMLPNQNFDEVFVDLLVYDEKGNLIPSQVVKEQSNVPIQWRKKVLFFTTLAPYSMNRFNAIQKLLTAKPVYPITEDAAHLYLSNSNTSLNISKVTGLLDSYIVNGKEYIQTSSGKLVVMMDTEDPWGMNTWAFTEQIGEFVLADDAQCAKISGVVMDKLTPIRVIEDGDICTVIEAAFCYQDSYAIVQYSFYKNTGVLGIKLQTFFIENNRMLKYMVGIALDEPTILGKTAFGLDNYEKNGDECVADEYIMCHDGDFSMTISNNGTYAFHVEDNVIGLSLVHTPAYCAHPIGDRTILPRDRFSDRIDIGSQTFEFEIRGGSYKERINSIQQESEQMNQPPEAVCFFPMESGTRPAPFCMIKNKAIQLTTCKRSEDGNGYILRFYNSNIEGEETMVEIPSRNINFQVSLKGLEVICYRISNSEAVETGILEY
jgi:alpha-mannosidase